jgi:C4-dicarboxylate-specific signal transduction histidine kinase
MLVLALSGLAAGAAVTEHRRAEAQLRRHQESLADVSRLGSMGELAAMVAHEINQPLMAAGTYARLVADGLRSAKDSAPVSETAEKTVTQVQRAADVVRQLRALIRLDQSNRAPVAVERIVRETVELYRPELDRHGIAVRLALDLSLPLVLVDLLQIEQVLLNLVKNATEAISDARTGGGTITIAARRHSTTHVLVLVQDTGPGFPAAVLGAELTPRPSKKADSLGIGLSLCRSIVESHGGELRISNAGGATAEFTLPAAQKD